jgi:hypothetical protein
MRQAGDLLQITKYRVASNASCLPWEMLAFNTGKY